MGYETGGPVTTWAFPGDPEPRAFWSEVNVDGSGGQNQPGDRRHLLSAGPFTMQPGESRTFDLAILFATGSDHLNSVTALKALSDAVQARYDAGDLFVPGPPITPFAGVPTLTAPADGAGFYYDDGPTLAWEPVPGADLYTVEVTLLGRTSRQSTTDTTLPTDFRFSVPSGTHPATWRVRAESGSQVGFFSEPRTFLLYRGGLAGPNGESIVEVANPAGPPCPDAGDPGCGPHGGNTVWLHPNATDDYYVSAYPDPVLGPTGLLQFLSVFDGEDLEVRFTGACAEPGACLGVYAQPPNFSSGAHTIASVPFELWFLGYDGPEDDVRMIPFLRANTFGEEHANWAGTFTATQASPFDPEGEVPVTEQIYWMMPDRPDGYDLFEQAAAGFGGPGASYDPANDGDAQVDPNPATGADCSRQGYYVDFCYRGGGTFVAPLSKVVLADLAGDGTTPAAGTAVRFVLADPFVVAAEEGPWAPSAARLLAPYPNPSRSGAAVPFEVERAGPVRLAVYDVLGRRVAVLVDEAVPAGRHEGRLEGRGLAGGVYVVVLEAGGARASRRLVILR